jgi:hypothetical protein
MFPLDELKQLEAKADTAAELGALKPIYERLNEIARQNVNDFDLQMAIADVRQRVIERGLELKHWGANGEAVSEAPPPPPPGRAFPGRTPTAAPAVASKAPAAKPEEPATPPKTLDLRRAIGIGAGLGVAAWLIIFVVLVQIARNRNMPSVPKAAAGTVAVDISTAPPGAKIRINGEEKCQSNCRVNLPPGNYQVTAVLDGFDPSATGVTVVPGNPINVSLALVAQTQTLKLYTDLDGGKVVLDNKAPVDLQDGQLVLDRVPNGKHSVRVAGKKADAAFEFEGASGKQPAITSPISANNVLALVVTSLGSHARIQTNSQSPLKIALNGQPAGETSPQGLELKDVPAGDHTLTVGEGQDQRKLAVSFGPMPTVTAYLKSDVNTGTLVVSTGENDVSVFLNGREYRRKTSRGELRVQTLGPVAVRVAKEGFLPEPEQRVEVKKGEETRVAFQMRPLPRVASLQVHNGVPGTQILFDDRALGSIGPDGTLSAANLPPGDHAIEVRRPGFITKRLLRTLRAGETLQINGIEIALPAAVATIHVTAVPANASVSYRRNGEPESHAVSPGSLRLEPGSYTFSARAPNFIDRTERVTIAAGETRNVELALTPEPKPAPPPPPPNVARAPDWSGWSREGGQFVRKGGNRVVVQQGISSGTITFTAHLVKSGGLFRGGKLRWFLDNPAGYSQFEVDKKKFSAKGDAGSRSREYDRDAADEDAKSFTVQIDVSADRIVHRMKVGEGWITVDTQPNRGENGAFGFVIPGNDEIAISSFRFSPR